MRPDDPLLPDDTFVNVTLSGDGPYACPCCRYLTLDERGAFLVCAVCGWQDDGQDDQDADRVRHGPNRDLSLTRARANVRVLGACHPDRVGRVRPPRDDEHPLAQRDPKGVV